MRQFSAALLLVAILLASPSFVRSAVTRSVLDQLQPDSNVTAKTTRDGLQITTPNKAEGYVNTAAEFSTPVTITAKVRTDSTNIRLHYGRGYVILNWEVNTKQLIHQDPAKRTETQVPNKGEVPVNKWVTVSWIVDEKASRIIVDGKERGAFGGDFAGLSGSVGIGTSDGATLVVNSLQVTADHVQSPAVDGNSAQPKPVNSLQVPPNGRYDVAYDNGATSRYEIEDGVVRHSGEDAAPIIQDSAGTWVRFPSGRWEHWTLVKRGTWRIAHYLNKPSGPDQRPDVNGTMTFREPLANPVQPKSPLSGRPADSAPVDIAVPCGPKSSGSVPAAAPLDPNAIEQPEYRDRPKALVKSLTSVTSMLVTIAEDGQADGSTGDIIAAVSGASRDSGRAGIGFVRSDGDSTMKTALEESVRAVTMRYPKWEPGHIDVSFGEKFVAHGGPSAGVAFALLQLSCLEGFDIDPKCAVTGDITVDWKVRRVGGVTAKLRGATLDKCLYALIPEDNRTAFTDMGVAYGSSAWWDIQTFSIATLQQAAALARTDRDHRTVVAIKLFADLQSKLDKSEQATLRDPQTIQVLQQILEKAPNHLSAQNLLALCQGTAPKTLSSNATIYQLSVAFYPYRKLLASDEGVNRTTLPAYVTVQTRKRLNALRSIAHPDLRPLLADIAAFVDAMDNWASRPSTGSAKAFLDRSTKLDGRIAGLDSDPNFCEKLIREGY